MSTLFDLDFTQTTSPFGFDTVANNDGVHGIIGVVDLGSGGVAPWTGAGARGTAIDVRSQYPPLTANGAQIRLNDPLINASDLCPSGYDGSGNIVLASGVLASLDLDFDDAKAKGYKMIVRLQFGADAPMGGTAGPQDVTGIANWMIQNTSASKFKPVPYAETIASSGTNRVCHVPIFWNDEKIHITGNPIGGTWTITFNGQTTTALNHNATFSQVQAALEALSNINPGQVAVAGSLETNGGTGLTIDYHAGLGAATATMTVAGSGLTGGTAPNASIQHAQANANMAYHYDAIMAAFAAYLEGTTSGGTRRKDYVQFVPVAMPTEIGPEMPLGVGTGSAYFDPVVTVNGVRIGNVNPSTGQVMVGTRSNGVHGLASVGPTNKASWFSRIARTYYNANTTDVLRYKWLSDWYHNPTGSTSVNGSTAAHSGAWMDAIAIHMTEFPNTASAVAYGGIFNDSYARAQDIIRQPTTVQTYGFTRLWTMQTNLRVYPPNGQNPATSTAPKNQWTYRNWSAVAADTMKLALTVAAPRTPLIGFQTAGASAVGNAYGMPPGDFIQATRDATATYKAQFIETYAAVWTNATKGAANSSYTNSEMNPALAANGALVASGGLVEKALHVSNDAVNAAGPYGRETAAVSGKRDLYQRFVVGQIGTFAGTATLLFTQVAAGANNGDFSLRLNTSSQLVARWNSSSPPDWTDTTALVPGDVVEVHLHYDQASPTTASGYEVVVNGVTRHTNFGLSSGTGGAATTISYTEIGLPTQVAAEFWFKHFGASDTGYLGSPSTTPVNTGAPAVAITSPFDGQQFAATNVTVTVTGQDPDSIATAHLSIDGGAWLDMVEQGTDPTNDTWSLPISLAGTPGTDVQHTIVVEMIDGFSSPLAGQDTITVTISLPSTGGGGGDTMPFAKTIYLGVEDYAAIHDRFFGMGHYVEGVAPRLGAFVDGSSTDAKMALAVQQRAAGANMSVDIQPGWAYVQGDDVVNQGMYADYNNGVVNLAYQTVGAPSTYPRIDMVVARINDSEHTTRTPADQMYFEIVPGSPLTGTLGATLANPLGRAALPPSALWLADLELHTDSGSVGITTAQIGDRRKLYGPAIYSENGKRYRLGIDANVNLGLEELV